MYNYEEHILVSKMAVNAVRSFLESFSGFSKVLLTDRTDASSHPGSKLKVERTNGAVIYVDVTGDTHLFKNIFIEVSSSSIEYSSAFWRSNSAVLAYCFICEKKLIIVDIEPFRKFIRSNVGNLTTASSNKPLENGGTEGTVGVLVPISEIVEMEIYREYDISSYISDEEIMGLGFHQSKYDSPSYEEDEEIWSTEDLAELFGWNRDCEVSAEHWLDNNWPDPD